MKKTNTPAAAFRPKPEWLALSSETALETDLPIIDAHHHLWDSPHPRYLLDEIQADVDCGHNILATVFVEAGVMWRQSGPASLRPVGEVEFANGVAAMSESGAYGKTRICAAIVGHAVPRGQHQVRRDERAGARAPLVVEDGDREGALRVCHAALDGIRATTGARRGAVRRRTRRRSFAARGDHQSEGRGGAQSELCGLRAHGGEV